MISENYDDLRHSMEVDCGMELTASSVRERLLSDARDSRTGQFATLYGAGHWQQGRGWFEQALREMAP